MIAALLLLQSVPASPQAADPPPRLQPQIAWACDMTAPDGKKFQIAGMIVGGNLADGETDEMKRSERVVGVTTDTSGRLKGSVGRPYLYASWRGEGFFSFSLPGPGDRYQVTLKLFENKRAGHAYFYFGSPDEKEVLGIGYCVSRWENPGPPSGKNELPQPEKKKP
jgi:hypothetical protein